MISLIGCSFASSELQIKDLSYVSDLKNQLTARSQELESGYIELLELNYESSDLKIILTTLSKEQFLKRNYELLEIK